MAKHAPSKTSSPPPSAMTEKRPERFVPEPIPPIPEPQGEHVSTEYSHFRTGLSRHRTGLSEHRTDLSEFRTDLSQHRTGLSEHRTGLSEHRTALSEHRTDLSTNRTEMSMRRTGLSFQRTRLSADRTMMSVIRTSLSLIGFGFTIFQAFQSLHSAGAIANSQMARNFGLILVILGMLVLVGGIVRDVRFEHELRQRRGALMEGGLLHGETRFPVSMNLIVAVALFVLGALAIARIAFNISLLS
jgi:uncharacterized membrane protein YidH (DUF202 family)